MATKSTAPEHRPYQTTRHCMDCNKWLPQAGGAVHPRRKTWQCAGCRTNTTLKKEHHEHP